MEKLVKPAEYAKMVGISRQAVYMKIKKGVIPSQVVDGKLYVVVEDDTSESISSLDKESSEASIEESYIELIKAKDETISILKDTIAELKENNKMITTTLKSEVELLKESFYEMKRLYTLQLEHISYKEEREAIDIDALYLDGWIEIDEWIKEYNLSEKKAKKILKRVKKLAKKGNSSIKIEDSKYYIKEGLSIKDIK